MGEKDKTEKNLEQYNDVFADINNVLLFNGERKIKEDCLEDVKDRQIYRDNSGKLREVERDITKRWTDGENRSAKLALIGLENQTTEDKRMPVRVMGYDGVTYQTQLAEDTEGKCPIYPAITSVLYFGMDRWKGSRHLKDVIQIPPELEKYVNDYEIRVFEIAWLTDEQVNMFTSDFKIVADYFVQKRKNNMYVPSEQEIKHVDAVLKMLSAVGHVEELEAYVGSAEAEIEERRPRKMCEFWDKSMKMAVKEELEARKDEIEAMLTAKRAEGEAEINTILTAKRIDGEAEIAAWVESRKTELEEKMKETLAEKYMILRMYQHGIAVDDIVEIVNVDKDLVVNLISI